MFSRVIAKSWRRQWPENYNFRKSYLSARVIGSSAMRIFSEDYFRLRAFSLLN